MSVRIAKKLIRSIIFLLCLQFLVPAFVQAHAQNTASMRDVQYQQAHDQSIVLLSEFLKENTEEREGESEYAFIAPEILDFTFLRSAITENHSGASPVVAAVATYNIPRHKALCTFLI